MQNVIIELIRSFDCGIIIAFLFLHLIPQTRKSFELFFVQLSATNRRSLRVVRTDFGETYEYRGIPFIELMICLSFFGIYFIEEFIQTCLRYRKYYWFSNANIMYSNGIYDFHSLNYRLNKTRDYLITCSRKTSEVTPVSNGNSIEKSVKINDNLITKCDETKKDSLDIMEMSADSLQPNSMPISLESEISSQLPSYWQNSDTTDETKVYLPQLTLATSMPILAISEGIVIASQENFDIFWMSFAVLLFHKIITAFVISFEIYEKTDRKMMPITSLISFSFLPAIGFFIVMFNNLIFIEDFNRSVCEMIFSSISAATLLHIILLCVRNNYIQFLAPLKNGIIQHFSMYTGFILILTSTAFINTKRLN
jgi:hypothetical protein